MSIQVIPNELVLATGGRFVGGLGLTMITSVSVDHRSSVDGSLFVPLKRAGADGHRHIEEAFRRGAVGALVQRDSGAAAGLQRNYPKKILVEVEDTLAALGEISRFWCQKLRVAVVVQACSGSVDELGSLVCRIIGQSLNAQHFQGSDDDLLQLPLFLMGLNAGNRAAVVEVGTGESERLRCLFELCDPAVVVIDDASFSGIMPERAAIVSGSDNVRVRDAARAAGLRLVSFGADDGDVTTSRVTQTASGKLECDLQLPGEDVLAGVQSAAGTSLESLLAAAAIAHVLGLSADAVRDGLAG